MKKKNKMNRIVSNNFFDTLTSLLKYIHIINYLKTRYNKLFKKNLFAKWVMLKNIFTCSIFSVKT